MDTELVSILSGLATALLGLLTWLGVVGARHVKQAYLQGVLLRAIHQVKTAYLDVQQTFVANAKDSNGNGKLDKEEADVALQMALAKAKTYIGTKGLSALAEIFGGPGLVDGWIKSEIEANVAEAKK